MIGNILNDKGLHILEVAPIFMMMFGYWQLGNRQQFFNDMPIRRHRNEVANPQHSLIDYTDGYNYTLIFII